MRSAFGPSLGVSGATDRRRLRAHTAAGVCLLALACGPGTGETGAEARWSAVIDTIGDTVVVRTVSGRRWPGDARLVSKVSVGVLEGEPEYQFGDLRAIAVDREGRMVAYDAQVPVLRVYAADGTWERDLGREGEGPGEYKRPDSGLAILPDGRVAVRDPGNGRITLYTPDGEYAGYHRIAGSFNSSRPMIADTSGALVTFIITNLGVTVFEWKAGHARYRSDGTVDTMSAPELGYEEAMLSGQSETSTSQTQVPFTPLEVVTFSPHGYYVAGVSDEYSFDLLRPEGVLRIEREYDPVPVDPAEAAAERERQTHSFRQQFPGWTWNGPPIPGVKPAYHALYPAADGRIWVHVPAPSARYLDTAGRRAEEERLGMPVNPFREPVRFDVFEATGEYLGRVETPAGFSLRPRPVFRGDTVWAVMRDELDVQRLHRFHVEIADATRPAD